MKDEKANNVYQLFDKFIDKCVISNNSILSDNTEIVTVENLKQILVALDERGIQGKEAFIVKAKRQFADESDIINEAFGNILWIWGLCSNQGSVKVTSKEDEIKYFYPNSASVFVEGFIDTGMYHARNKPFELIYIANILIKLKNIKEKNDLQILKEKAIDIIKKYDSDSKVVMKNLFLHLFNYDYYEDIASYNHKNQICNFWKDLSKNDDIDDCIFEIRSKLKNKYGAKFSFYQQGLKELWDLGYIKSIKEIIKQLEKDEIKAWTYKPGKNATVWEECYNEGIVRFGFDDKMEHLFERDRFDIDTIKEVVKEINTESKNPDITKAIINKFVNVISRKDLLFAFKGNEHLIGIGVVKNKKKIFRNDLEYLKTVRFADWILDLSKNPIMIKGNVDLSSEVIQHTILELTNDNAIKILNYVLSNKDLIPKLEKIISQNINQILFGPPGTGKTFKTKEIAVSIINAKEGNT